MDDEFLAKLRQEAKEAPLRERILVPIAFYALFASIGVALLAAPVLVFQTLRWLRTGVWKPISLRTGFHLQGADTSWIGLNMILDRLADGELAAVILIVAFMLFCLSAVATWIATA